MAEVGVQVAFAYREGGKNWSYSAKAPVAVLKSWLPATTVFGTPASSSTFRPVEVWPHWVRFSSSLTRSPSCTTIAVLSWLRVSTTHWACWTIVPCRLLYV